MTGTSVYSAKYLMEDRKIPVETLARAIQVMDNESCPEYDFDIKKAIHEVQNPNVKFFFLVDDQTLRVVGYLDIISLDDKHHQKVIQGTFKDGELDEGVIPIQGEVNLYIRGFVISSQYRSNNNNFKLMIQSLMQWIFDIPRDYEAQVLSVTARGLTESGQNLCKAFGFEKVCDHREKGKIYRFLWNQAGSASTDSRYGKKIVEDCKKQIRG
jgi:hypothetical protein